MNSTLTSTSHLTRTRVALAAAACLLAVGAPTAYATLADDVPTGSVVAPARGTPYVETRLLFGTERPDGGPAVTDEQFRDFVDKEVTPGFPNGLTVREGRGQWRDANGAVEKERSYELILLYPVVDAEASDRKIEEIRGDYRKAFAQESVARVDDRKRVDF
ncbi:DUF3574 domain-containing protein [Streptomyces ipomoeae]|jgi:hypothetical protein|uniref:Lipoprotein n=2 Tax=Streptomyces ipomoeae TaxID=103232 RepID=L1KGY7_9ACTN|nr:DUF3574 domain-containing protein [Streptomyces ipomoeae]EKX60081.1 hypothetical protein STRIP9103_01763 [Streptomyces ipomoeae 91-03]MDX2699954.1 DUF3574 domain-containing protein [Streptomyces ipomoeae]MDX2827526.1 DUF3574 domain-containing protein [Streptomyces ipomoeae]MDX2845587.1 DUF3574 domain-containing protein [Streptomyces ipomoeae]MDX2880063.1 DUF3574 domain-containing protein [Streptomyces ipomoeae]